jgi:hypothetical protein
MNKEELLTYEIAIQNLAYDKDTGEFTWKWRSGNRLKLQTWNSRFAGMPAGCLDSRGYLVITINYVIYQGHRIAWLMTNGAWPSKIIDHINGVRNDNRICNLREATHSQNMQNRKVQANNTSGYRGVTWSKKYKNWRARIKVGGKCINIGAYSSPESASEAYEAARIKYHDIPIIKL